MSEDRKPQGQSQTLEDGDWIARQFFSIADLQLSPEEYAARYAHLWGCFALDRYRYADPVLGAWVRRLADILSSEEEVERFRHHFLTGDELSQVKQGKSEGF